MSTTPTDILETTAPTVAQTIEATLSTDPTAATEAALDIASIKDLMDGFDPGALLPELEALFTGMAGICRIAVLVGPILLLILGLAYLLLAPKEANHYFGYRTYYGMGSIPAWRFTQRLAGAALGILGLGLTIAMLLISGSFDGMPVMDMVWRTVWCLVWQAGLSLAVTLGINGVVTARFDRYGELRKKKKR